MLFDEEWFVEGMGIDLEGFRKEGSLIVEQIDAAELSPGEFAHRVGQCVKNNGVRTVIIDSLNGYQMAMPENNPSFCICMNCCNISIASAQRPL